MTDRVGTAEQMAAYVSDQTTARLDDYALQHNGGSKLSGRRASSGSLRPDVQRIVHISKHCGYANGSVHVAVDLACGQARAGYDVTFMSSGGTFVPLLEQQGVRHVMLPHSQQRPHTLLIAAARLTRFCREERPTVLHAHMMGATLIGYAASRLTGIPLVTTVHNSFDRHSILMRLADGTVAVSQAERDHLVQRGYDPAKLSVIWNAPEKSPRAEFMRNDKVFELSRPCIAVICALHRRKGVFDIINAFAVVSREFPEWRLYIAGEGPDRQELEQQVASSGLSDRVSFLGFVPVPRPIFEQADIFVLASYADPGSLSIGEARAAGCAIVATAVGGTSEMLGYGTAGRLVAPGSPPQLVVELRRLMRDPEARAALRKGALENVDVFDSPRLVPDYDRAYAKAAARMRKIPAA